MMDHARLSVLLIGLCLSVSACAVVGDLGRPRLNALADGRHPLADAASGAAANPASSYPLTDDERLLRDLAYGLITPPYDREHWNLRLAAHRQTEGLPNFGPALDPTAYGTRLLARPYRSATARYDRLVEDIRADIGRIGPFFATARRVADMDRKRARSLAYISAPADVEMAHVKARIDENAWIIGWVQQSLRERTAAYRYALERLVIATPSPAAVAAERALNELKAQIRTVERLPAA